MRLSQLPRALFPALRPVALLTATGLVAASSGAGLVQSARAGALFAAVDLPQERFVLVSAPIGDGIKGQLNIYEQLNSKRPCFAMTGSQPAKVDPLLASFDFTGICNRFIDANGYSLRIGDTDLATSYRLSVIRKDNDNLLVALPTKAGAGPELLVARTQGPGNGFTQLVFEPGWQLKRRAFRGRQLGHVYVYREIAPTEPTAGVEASRPVSVSAVVGPQSPPVVPPIPRVAPVPVVPPAPLATKQ